VTTVNPAAPARDIVVPKVGFYDGLKVVLDNGEHLILLCDAGRGKHCDLPFDVNTGTKKNCWSNLQPNDPNSNAGQTCIYTSEQEPYLGTFAAVVGGNTVTISGPRGKLKYEKTGTWSEDPVR
jgi:hypothetical protein